MQKLRITIGGCRDFNDYVMFCSCIEKYLKTVDDTKKIIFLSGHCSGADEMAEKYAKEKGYVLEIYPADWKKYGKAAGPKRNKEMVEKSDIIIAFWDGKSKGTKNLIDLAKKKDIQIKIYNI